MKPNESWCLICRASVVPASPVPVVFKNGRKALRGECPNVKNLKPHAVFRMLPSAK